MVLAQSNRWRLVLGFGLLGSAAAQGEAPQLLGDLNLVPPGESDPMSRETSSKPRPQLALGSKVILAAETVATGRELWAFDTETSQLEMLADAGPGPTHSYPEILGTAGGSAYFTAEDSPAQDQLWVTDGTAAGTKRVSYPFSEAVYSSFDDRFRPGCRDAGGRFLFTERKYLQPSQGRIWSTDGTSPGTQPITGYLPNIAGYVNFCAEAPGEVWFTTPASELWTTDGSATGTHKLIDFPSTPAGQVGRWLNGRVLFRANDDRIWSTDGTAEGTAPLTDAEGHTSLLISGGRAFFVATDDAHGQEVWGSDGTPEGTTRLTDLTNAGAFDYYPSSNPLGAFGTRVLLLALDGAGELRLWSADRDGIGTVELLSSVCFDEDCLGGLPQFSEGLFSAAGGVVFLSTSDASGLQLHRSDGTAEGTEKIGNQPSDFGTLVLSPRLLDGFVLFYSEQVWDDGDVTQSSQLWISDGTAAGTFPLTTFPLGEQVSHDDVFPDSSSWRESLLDEVWFSAWQPTSGLELWRSDGTAGSAELAFDLAHTGLGSLPGDFAEVGQLVTFTASEVEFRSYWRSDGSAAGTFELSLPECWRCSGRQTAVGPRLVTVWDDFPRLRSANPMTGGQEVLLGDRAASYGAFDLGTQAGAFIYSSDGLELWQTDGTSANTTLQLDLPDLVEVSSAESIGGLLYFMAESDSSPIDLWRSDGTPQGTYRLELERFFDGSLSGMSIQEVSPQIGQHFVLHWLGRWWLFRTDGSVEGTYPIATDKSLVEGGSPVSWLDGRFFFLRSLDHPSPVRLQLVSLSADGVDEDPIADVGAGAEELHELVATFSRLFFTLHRDTEFWYDSGVALWTSDGTPQGTFEIEIAPPFLSAWPSQLIAVGDRLFFTAFDAGHGFELWSSDGTQEGTVLYSDIVPGPLSSTISNLMFVDGTLYFGADDGTTGVEPWALVFDVHPLLVFGDGFETGDASEWSEAQTPP